MPNWPDKVLPPGGRRAWTPLPPTSLSSSSVQTDPMFEGLLSAYLPGHRSMIKSVNGSVGPARAEFAPNAN
jgi:hypothetical protein